MKNKFFFFPLFFFVISIQAQKKTFNKYNQQIPGTEASINMVPIKGGNYTMGSLGSEANRATDEGPTHQVDIAAFWMADFEITWNLYELFMAREIDSQTNSSKGNEVSADVDAVSGATTPYVEMSFGMGTDGYPAVCMTQLAASKFCEWLSAMTGNYYRLPTEAEWEYACRAGSTTAYSFGNDIYSLKEYAWSEENSNNAYHKVGSKKPNAWGLYDMHGNVAEWTLDQYAKDSYKKYKGKTAKNPYEKAVKRYPRSVRGGSWADDASKLRSAAREASAKDWKIRDPQIPKSIWWHTDASFVGFRIVRPYKTPSLKEQKNYWQEK